MKRTPLQERVGAAIRRRREALKFSQDDFADHVDMHRSYYGALERGKKNLQLTTLERVCEGLGAPVWEVLRDAESQ
ncbi:MAG: helix-turn-helix transcriptional regulator [Gammaproteobacteria bacterium]